MKISRVLFFAGMEKISLPDYSSSLGDLFLQHMPKKMRILKKWKVIKKINLHNKSYSYPAPLLLQLKEHHYSILFLIKYMGNKFLNYSIQEIHLYRVKCTQRIIDEENEKIILFILSSIFTLDNMHNNIPFSNIIYILFA